MNNQQIKYLKLCLDLQNAGHEVFYFSPMGSGAVKITEVVPLNENTPEPYDMAHLEGGGYVALECTDIKHFALVTFLE